MVLTLQLFTSSEIVLAEVTVPKRFLRQAELRHIPVSMTSFQTGNRVAQRSVVTHAMGTRSIFQFLKQLRALYVTPLA